MFVRVFVEAGLLIVWMSPCRSSRWRDESGNEKKNRKSYLINAVDVIVFSVWVGLYEMTEKEIPNTF